MREAGGNHPSLICFDHFVQSTPQLRTPFNYCILYHYIIVHSIFFMHAACMCYGPAMDTQTSAYTHNIYIYIYRIHLHIHILHTYTHIYIYIRDHHHLWGEGGLYIYIHTYMLVAYLQSCGLSTQPSLQISC